MLILATLAVLAAQSDTRCVTNGAVTNCQTQTLPPMQAQPAPDMTGVFSLLRGNPNKRRQKKIAKMIAAGECQQAQTIAVEAGDYTAAEYITRNCVQRKPQ